VDNLDFDKLAASPLQTDPYDHILLPEFVRSSRIDDLIANFPKITGPGSHPLESIRINDQFRSLIDDMEGDRFRSIIEDKFDLDLSGNPTMVTIRGNCRPRDGSIHTDSLSKIITVLLYLNHSWDKGGGRLRILRSATDLNDYVAEVPPDNGALLVFRRSENSWHGHEPFGGKRQALQLNWMVSEQDKISELRRHKFSSTLKRLNPLNAFG